MRQWSVFGLAIALWGCEPAVIDHSPDSNLFDADSASLEGGLGQWAGWYSAEVSRSAEAARAGEAGLRVEVTAPYGWGVQLDNWPGLAAAPGLHRASFWVSAAQGAPPVELRLTWRDGNAESLGSEVLTSPEVSTQWVRTVAEVTAPAGTEHVSVDLTGSEGAPGDLIDLDAFVLQAEPRS